MVDTFDLFRRLSVGAKFNKKKFPNEPENDKVSLRRTCHQKLERLENFCDLITKHWTQTHVLVLRSFINILICIVLKSSTALSKFFAI